MTLNPSHVDRFSKVGCGNGSKDISERLAELEKKVSEQQKEIQTLKENGGAVNPATSITLKRRLRDANGNDLGWTIDAGIQNDINAG